MNQGEYLKTLNNKDLVDWWVLNVYPRTFIDGKEQVMPQSTMEKLKNILMNILESPHETTADEDFLEIGFELISMDAHEEKMVYKHNGNLKEVVIYEAIIYYDSPMQGVGFDDKQIDKIRKIADKKRKELGWI